MPLLYALVLLGLSNCGMRLVINFPAGTNEGIFNSILYLHTCPHIALKVESHNPNLFSAKRINNVQSFTKFMLIWVVFSFFVPHLPPRTGCVICPGMIRRRHWSHPLPLSLRPSVQRNDAMAANREGSRTREEITDRTAKYPHSLPARSRSRRAAQHSQFTPFDEKREPSCW